MTTRRIGFGILGIVAMLGTACGGASQQVASDQPARAAGGGEVRKGPAGEDLTMRETEAPKAPEYVEGVDHAAQDAFRKGVIAVSKTMVAQPMIHTPASAPSANSSSTSTRPGRCMD